MKFKQKNNLFVGNFNKNFVGSIFYENALIFSKILKQAKNYNLFEKKIRYTKARIVAKSFFGFEKRNYNFKKYLANKKKKKISKISVIFNLISLSLKVKNLGNRLLESFATKFVGKEAQFLVNNFLNTYITMYKFWYENEKWGFFDEDLTEKTKLKLMKYFWLNKSRRFLRSKLWSRAHQHHRFGFKYVKKFGYNLRNLKITDQLFFWHAFTRKKLKQTLWLSRTCQIFRRILYLKKKKSIFKNFMQKNIVFNFCDFVFYNFFVNNKIFAKKLALNLLNQVQTFFVITRNIDRNFEVLINQSCGIILFSLFPNFGGKINLTVLKNIILFFFVFLFLKGCYKRLAKKKISSLYTNAAVTRFFYTKNRFAINNVF